MYNKNTVHNVCCVLLTLLAFPVIAQGAYRLLVGPLNTAEILTYDGHTGASLSPFATGQELDQSGLMAIGPDGDIYVTNGSDDRVDRFDRSTGNHISTVISNIDSPAGLAFGPDGDMYVSSGNPPHGLFRYHFDGASWIQVPAPAYSGSISGIAFDSNGSLYVSTYADNSVLKWNETTSVFDTFVSPGSGGLNLSKNIMFGPGPDGHKDLYVCGGFNDAIMRYDGLTGLPKGISEGDARFAYGGGLDHPSDLDFGMDGNLYVVGTRNPGYAHHGVLRYDGSTGNFMDVFGEAVVGSESLLFVPEPLTDLMEWKIVWDVWNVGELSGAGAGGYGTDRICGAVPYEYRIGKYEVTNAEYATFLNAVARTDSYSLYNTAMGSGYGGITRSGSSGSYSYEVIPGRGDKPVNYVSFWDACRFANWLHNGEYNGSTETGAYSLNSVTDPPNASISRNAGAKFAVASEDEWYKAAYYRPGSTNGYWDYPTQSDTAPTAESPPGMDLVNGSANYNNTVADLTDVGAYTAKPSESPYGTFDQGGNLWEWNEAIIGSSRGVRGGSFVALGYALHAAHRDPSGDPSFEAYSFGFRVVMLPPLAPDFDYDGDVDLTDFSVFASCFNGPNRPPACP
ncbi:MAG: SUMF1/EgtB/PvdO family nonheme iron enzyme [Phycisphaerae bacterium]|nr:SUMF1/EgtB/PvdO family nonheme iron enzyme [Phycisphaerae bacterium]